MFPSASKLFSGMNMGAHIAHDPCKRDKKAAEKERKKSSGVILEESEEGALSKLKLVHNFYIVSLRSFRDTLFCWLVVRTMKVLCTG